MGTIGPIKFPPSFSDKANARAVTRDHVERAIRNPKWVSRLMPDGADFPREAAMTAWLAEPRAGSTTDPFSLLITTREEKGQTVVYDAWRVYHSDVDLSNARSASDAFAFFLARYGMDVEIGGTTSRLFTYARLPIDPSKPVVRVIGANQGKTFQVSQLVRINTSVNPPVAEVAVAFAIDEGALRHDLALHGVFLRG